ncbi:M48 family metallopeptidase [Catenulispora pinisilvae]|uniref:M48 family metallopeptidase n=1 Tax=Catenulispora pinisilvae TaxID=2705253 RepID=UPI001891A196|nr:SprT family zinc-dependent metalloprotease [Catenulispora pinisilvae]
MTSAIVCSAECDTLTFRVQGQHVQVRIGARRRMALSVEHDGTPVLHLPAVHDHEEARRFLDSHGDWIARKQSDRARLALLKPAKQLLDGEGFLVLGRNRMLQLVDDTRHRSSVTLTGTTIEMPRELAADQAKARDALKAMYRAVGREWLLEGFRPWAGRLGIEEPPISVRDLGGRWGSFSRTTGAVTLHWAAFQLPDPLVAYVLTHELTHALVSHHGKAFWSTLRDVLPECDSHRRELDLFARQAWLGEIH